MNQGSYQSQVRDHSKLGNMPPSSNYVQQYSHSQLHTPINSGIVLQTNSGFQQLISPTKLLSAQGVHSTFVVEVDEFKFSRIMANVVEQVSHQKCNLKRSDLVPSTIVEKPATENPTLKDQDELARPERS